MKGLAALTVPLMLMTAGCGAAAGQGSEAADTLTVSSGTLTVQVPKEWSLLDESDTDLIRDPWVAGALDNPNEMRIQLRMTANTGVTPYADATNAQIVFGNTLAQEGEVHERGSEAFDVTGADQGHIQYFEYIDTDGDSWNGYFLSAANRETGNVATIELISLNGSGMSQDDALEIAHSAVYDKSQEPGAQEQ